MRERSKRRLLVGLVCALTAPADAQVIGTARLVKDVGSAPVLRHDGPSGFVAAGPLTYFTASDPLHGQELWRTDGSAAGTQLVRDFTPGPDGIEGWSGVELGAELLLGVGDSIYLTDGSDAGTRLVAAGVNLGTPVTIGGQVYFSSPVGGVYVPWITDGTAAGTIPLADGDPSRSPMNPSEFTAVNGLVVFAADGPTGRQLYVSDGSPVGTQLLADIWPWIGSNPHGFCALGADAFFLATRRGRRELWATDGSAARTRLIAQLDGWTAYDTLASFGGGGVLLRRDLGLTRLVAQRRNPGGDRSGLLRSRPQGPEH